jgi:hypothetical protein
LKSARQDINRYYHYPSFGIGIDPLIGFNILVTETAETYNIPNSGAAFRVIKEIEDYRKIIGPKKELSRLAVQIYTMNEILGRKNNAVMALLNLQSRGVTEDQILSMYIFFEEYVSCHLALNKYKTRLIYQTIMHFSIEKSRKRDADTYPFCNIS